MGRTALNSTAKFMWAKSSMDIVVRFSLHTFELSSHVRSGVARMEQLMEQWLPQNVKITN
jgi:hypothetical protein